MSPLFFLCVHPTEAVCLSSNTIYVPENLVSFVYVCTYLDTSTKTTYLFICLFLYGLFPSNLTGTFTSIWRTYTYVHRSRVAQSV
jgi:hypothetical protein